MVQGVGFRPHVFRLATEHGLCGQVANSLTGVELILEGDAAQITLLLEKLQASPPPGATILSTHKQTLSEQKYTDFTIAPSLTGGSSAPLAPADFGMCPKCEQELRDPSNHRFQHPFISCTSCGPRFTLLHDLPYDRPLTSMADFPLCPICTQEYRDPTSRRFHAEPICCPDCGPRLTFYDKNGGTKKNALGQSAAILQGGGVLAIKGVGGFHLAVDACNEQAVSRLRTIKHRAAKPLAIMVRDLKRAASLAQITAQARDLLLSPARPIVIMEALDNTPATKKLSPGLHEVGIMLAYTPLHYLLFDQAPAILVMTSFNEPGSPMLTRTKDARARLGTACDAILSHDRRIISRCDDSVYRIHGTKAQILRRSRGYTPLPVKLASEFPPILACGAGEKVTLCLTRGKMAFFSQHLGDTRSPVSQTYYQKSVHHLQSLLRINPQLIAHDLHPDYFSSRFAMAHPSPQKIAVQHHHAHIASCMTENKIDRPVLGLALDGTGLGTDGTLWGGEILLATMSNFKRLAHFAPLAMPGGEAAIKEPWRLALAWLHQEGIDGSKLAFAKKIPKNGKKMVAQMLNKEVNCPTTSSVGRLFDAVAALIDLRCQTTFSGQAAMELEAISDSNEGGSYPFEISPQQTKTPMVIETRGLLKGIIDDLQSGVEPKKIGGRFHNTLIEMLTTICLELAKIHNIYDVACSGGVFQNKIISQGLEKSLRKMALTVHCHHEIPCNDGGLALGQAAVAAALFKRKEKHPPLAAGTSNA